MVTRPDASMVEAGRIARRRALSGMGVFPPSARFWIKNWRKGSYLRARRGLPDHEEI